MAATALLVNFGCAVPQPRGNGRLDHLVEPTTNRGYYLYLPSEYVRADDAALHARRWPLVVSFHGMKPFDIAYYQACEWQQEADRYGFVVVAPELRAPDVFAEFPLRTIHSGFKSDELATLAILDQVFTNTLADPNNVLATSWSSGGYMAHYMVNRHPQRFTCLAVRQSNFSPSVMDPSQVSRSLYHPVLIVNTQHDFDICIRESREAIQWYESHGFKNMAWVMINRLGHERTPDLAADFFARVAGVEPNRPPEVLVGRQAIDGNASGLALLAGNMGRMERAPLQRPTDNPPAARPVALTPGNNAAPAPTQPRATMLVARPAGAPRTAPEAATNVASPPAVHGPATAARVPPQPVDTAPAIGIRVSTAIGLEPLNVGFSAEVPADWMRSADFLWSLNGQPIATGVNGSKTLTLPGDHELGLLVVTTDGVEHRASRTIRVFSRPISGSSQ